MAEDASPPAGNPTGAAAGPAVGAPGRGAPGLGAAPAARRPAAAIALVPAAQAASQAASQAAARPAPAASETAAARPRPARRAAALAASMKASLKAAGSSASAAGEASAAAAGAPGADAARSPEEERAKVIHLVQRLQAEASQSRAGRAPVVALSLMAAVALPTLVMALYFLVFAADRYVSEARFAVRSNDAQNASVLGMLSGLPASTIVSDSYIVADYIHSREMVEELERRVGLRALYASPEADYFTRLDRDATLEELIAYWKSRSDVYYDSTKNTIAVEVQAFTPADAQRIAAEIVAVVQGLVNDLSANSRRDAVRFAASEVARAELRVRGARQDMLAFRTEHNEFDPTATAAATSALSAQLEAERSQLNSQLAAVSGYLAADAPSVQMLKARIAALTAEIGRVQSQISQDPLPAQAAQAAPAGDRLAASTDAAASGAATGPAGGNALASVVGRYQELLLNQEFAETAYTAAQASLEAARTDAARTQSYLAIYVHPKTADDAAYPRRGLNTLMVLILASVLWAVAALAAMTVKDHMP